MRRFWLECEPMSDERMGRYQIVQLLATGGMGEVYLGRSDGPAGFSKVVVIKRILPFLAKDAGAVELFLNEARVAAMLSHPNLVQIFELGEESDTYFLAMEYVHGRSLRAVRGALQERSRVLVPTLAAALCAQALRGLHHAHTFTDARGEALHIVHRDVSPENILVGFDGTVKVTDFGIAKVIRAVGHTNPGKVKGKLSYIAPEQVQAQALDGRADIFAMGAVLYELICGQSPYQVNSVTDYFDRRLLPAPVAPSELNPMCPTALSGAVVRALSWDPEERFPTALNMAQVLEAAAELEGLRDPVAVAAFMHGLFGGTAAANHPAVASVAHLGIHLDETQFPRPLTVDVGVVRRTAPLTAPLGGSAASAVPRVTAGQDGEPAELSADPIPGPLPWKSSEEAVRADTRAPVQDGERAQSTADVIAAATQSGRRGRTLRIAGAMAVALVAMVAATVTLTPASRSADDGAAGVATAAAANGPGGTSGVAAPQAMTSAAAPPSVDAAPPSVTASSPPPPAEPPRPSSASKQSVRPGRQVAATRAKRARPAGAPPAPGKLNVRASPWAEVSLGDRSLGVTPIAGLSLPAGRHVLVLTYPPLGERRQVVVHIPEAGEATVKQDFLSEPAR